MTSTDTTARAVAASLLQQAPRGRLTVLNGAALESSGGWPALGEALNELADELSRHLTVCELGDTGAPIPHELTEALTGNNIRHYLDLDTQYLFPEPDWDDPDPDADSGQLPTRETPAALSSFGDPSLLALARHFNRFEPTDGLHPALLIEVDGGRPYAEILRRQAGIGDTVARAAALSATHGWLADDLVTLAAFRPTETTIIASDDRSAEWAALADRAALVLPVAHRLRSV